MKFQEVKHAENILIQLQIVTVVYEEGEISKVKEIISYRMLLNVIRI